MSNIRVAMLAPPWLPIPPEGYGGVENVLAALVPALLELGVKVELFTTQDSTIKATKIHALYKTGQYSYVHKPQYDSLPISVAHFMFALNIIREDGGFDVIHDHDPWYLSLLALAGAGDDLPPAIHTIHGPPFHTPERQALGIPDNRPMWEQFSRATAKKLYVVGISEALMKTAPKALAGLTLPPVHNGVDLNHFPFVKEKSDYFITLARFHPEKGQDIAARLCAELGYNLKMAGNVGDISSPRKLMLELANPLSVYRGLTDFRYYSDQIFPLANGKIDYVGMVGGQHKLDFISHAKALLFPIQWDEPFGMAPIEALACGTPVVAMNRGAMPEIIEHGVNGFLANNEAEFKEYMTRVHEISPAACRESVERNFSAPAMARRYLERYQAVIGPRG